MSDDRIIGADVQPEDVAETKLRPQRLDEFVGQAAVCDNLAVFITAAIKTVAETEVGDTITDDRNPTKVALEGFKTFPESI